MISEDKDLSLGGATAALTLCMLFGSNAVAIKAGLAEVGVFFLAGIRFAIASGVLMTWAVVTRQTIRISRTQTRQMILLSSIFLVQVSLFYFGVSKTNASRSTLIVNLQPFFVLFLAHFFIPGDKITVRKLIGILLAFLGVALVFLEKKGTTADFQTGDVLMLVVAILWAVNAIYTKTIIAAYSPFQIALYPMMIAVPFFLLQGFIFDTVFIANWNMTVFISLAYQSLVTASFGFIAWNSLLKKYGAFSLHSFVFIIPVSGVIFGGLILGEPVTYKLLIALALIAAGLLFVHLRQDRFPPIFPLGRNV